MIRTLFMGNWAAVRPQMSASRSHGTNGRSALPPHKVMLVIAACLPACDIVWYCLGTQSTLSLTRLLAAHNQYLHPSIAGAGTENAHAYCS